MLILYLVRRCISSIVTASIVAVLVFTIITIIPGDPAQSILGHDASAEAVSALRHRLGLDRPLLIQFTSWYSRAATGDLGHSLFYDQPVSSLIRKRLPITITLALSSLLLITIIGLPSGIITGLRRGGPVDALIMGCTQLLMAIPPFSLSLLLILGFSLAVRWFPPGGFPGWSHPAAAIRALILPAIALTGSRLPIIIRMTRVAVVEAAGEDYIRTARAKGLPQSTVIARHILKNALIPTVTSLGLQLGILLTGSIIVEQIFALPGLGRLIYHAVNYRDLPLLLGCALFSAVIIICLNAVVDIICLALDPRIHYDRAGGEG